ncbi:MAG: peptide deformylase [Clostridia bacterium]|jgi:peptide deformylase|nr:peptide deformylase [Clostridia bacterium]MBP5731019.1 peptide deformylase [Clostridia bacterium]
MAIRRIRTDGEEILRMKCKPVKDVSDSIRSLIGDMFETMYASNGVGLAAPQIGILRRLAVIDDTQGNKLAIINPVITSREGEQLATEGCLSLPGYQGEVKRAEKIHVDALDENGEPLSIDAEGFFAVVLQHEIDHLDGILYKDKAETYVKQEAAQQ